MSFHILHLVGSPTDEFSYEISLLYARSFAAAKYEAAKDHINIFAVVDTDGLWSFPEDLTQESMMMTKKFSVTDALSKILKSKPDLMVQHILCDKRPIFTAMFEVLNIPCLGSGSQVSANIVDKAATRALLLQADLPVPPGTIVTKNQSKYQGSLPAVVKPSKMENSVGVHLVRNEDDLQSAIEEAFTYGDTAVVDAFIPGREIRCAVIENNGELQPLPCMEYKVDSHKIRSYSDKLDGNSQNLRQAAKTVTWFLDPTEESDLIRKIEKVAVAAHKALGCRDFSQIDCRVSFEGDVYILEMNSFCSFGPISLIPKLAEKKGIKAGDLYSMMVKNALRKSKIDAAMVG